MDDDNYATVLESFVSLLLLCVAQVNNEKVSGLDLLFLPKSKVFHPRMHWKQFMVPHSMVSAQHCICPCLGGSGQRIINHGTESYCKTLFATTMSRKGNRCAQFFITNFCLSHSFPMKLKSEALDPLSRLSQQDGVPPPIIPKKWSSVSLTENSRRHYVSWGRQSYSCHGQMLLKER